MLFFWLCVSAVFLVIVNAIASSREGSVAGRATLVSIAAGFALFFCIPSAVLWLNALLVGIVAAICWAARARPRWFLVSSLGATLAAYVLIALPDLRAWNRLKKEFPLESLAGRLAYEDRPRHSLPDATFTQASRTTAHPDRLADLEARVKQEENWGRVPSLKRLHAGVVQQFIDSPGFGVGRKLRRPSPFYLESELDKRHETPKEDPIPQPEPAYSSLELVSAESKVAGETSLLSAHDENTIHFLNPQGFGYVRSREQVAGFLPHQFRDVPHAPERCRVGRLELVGMLKYEEPVVYLSPNLPRMDELSKAPTRPLDAFEKKALEGLLGGEDLMVQKTPQRLRMLGSIRAIDQCVRCHRVQRGELLGAFSYKMSPEK